jgi:predicted small lipoprotein YifL
MPRSSHLGPRTLWDKAMKLVMRTVAIFFLLSAITSFSGCGKKGALLPPEALVPASVRDLNVIQSGQEFRITWRAPAKEQGGKPLKDLSGFLLSRRDVSSGDCPSCPDSWQLLSRIDLDSPGSTQKSGDLFLHFDKSVEMGNRIQYRLTALSRSGGRSRPADTPLKTVFQPPPPPTITATLQPASIRIGFKRGKGTDFQLIGFNVYRRTVGAAPPLLPLNQEPVSGNSWEDQSLEYGTSYRYSATALTQIEGELVESPRSEETEILFKQLELR